MGPSNVQRVQAQIATERPLAYTTVQTMLNLLWKKKKVKCKLKEKAYVYQATVTRHSAISKVIGDLDRLRKTLEGSDDSK